MKRFTLNYVGHISTIVASGSLKLVEFILHSGHSILKP